MRIAYDHQIFSTQVYGGVSRYFARIAETLSRWDQSVAVFAPFYLNQELKKLNPRIVRGKSVSTKFPKTNFLVRKLNQQLARRPISEWAPDILHETYYYHDERIISGDFPIVITVHDMIHELFPQLFSSHDKTAKRKKKAIFRADHVICVSENTRRDLLSLYDLPIEKTSVVHLGTENLTKLLPAALPGPIDAPYLLYVGERSAHKNFEGLLRAVSHSTRLSSDFCIVAYGGGALNKVEKKLITELGFKTNQVLQLSGDDRLLKRLYLDAAALIYPSIYEGFGLPPLEAMACGCPVVCSKGGSIPEVVGNAGTYFDAYSQDDITKSIEDTVYANREDLQKLIKSGSLRQEIFTWDACASRTLEIYKKLV